jgi:hypothetical protein
MLPFPLNGQVPLELKNYIFDFWWDMTKLHRLRLPIQTIPVQTIPVADLRWHLNLPWWQYDGKFFCLTPHQVQQEPQKYHEQYERTMNADLQYPIVVRIREERFIIMDGIHRLLKTVMLGKTEITGKVFSEEDIPRILR